MSDPARWEDGFMVIELVDEEGRPGSALRWCVMDAECSMFGYCTSEREACYLAAALNEAWRRRSTAPVLRERPGRILGWEFVAP